MSAAGLFESTTRFRRVLELVGKAHGSGRLGRVLVRAAQAAGTPGDEGLSKEEANALPAALGLGADAVEGVGEELFNGLRYIFETGAWHGATGEQLAEELLALGLDADACGAIRDTWSAVGKEVVGELKKRTLEGPCELKSVKIETHVHLGHRGLTNGRDTGAIIEFTTASTPSTSSTATPAPSLPSKGSGESATAAVGGEAMEDVIAVDFSQEQLADLLVSLDAVQKQLDELG